MRSLPRVDKTNLSDFRKHSVCQTLFLVASCSASLITVTKEYLFSTDMPSPNGGSAPAPVTSWRLRGCW